jgi:hypothetical protein
MHPTVVKIARTRFESGHFADAAEAAEAAFKEVNDIVRQIGNSTCRVSALTGYGNVEFSSSAGL